MPSNEEMAAALAGRDPSLEGLFNLPADQLVKLRDYPQLAPQFPMPAPGQLNPAAAGAEHIAGELTGVNDATKILRGEMTPQEQQDTAITSGLGLAAGAGKGVAAAASKFVPAIFAGVGAKTADRDALAMAHHLFVKGAPAEDIWRKTGWFKAPDNKWKFEIPDVSTKLNVDLGEWKRRPLGQIMEHPELYSAYPDMRSISTHIDMTGAEPNTLLGLGHYSPKGVMPEEMRAIGKTPSETIGNLLHETQHAIQQREGFAKGGNPATIWDTLINLRGGKPVSNTEAHDAYRRLAGEVEARNVSTRFNSAPLWASSPPWASSDVPVSKQIAAKDFNELVNLLKGR